MGARSPWWASRGTERGRQAPGERPPVGRVSLPRGPPASIEGAAHADHQGRANRVRSVRHIARLQEPNRDALVLYARFIGDSVDYVLNQLIETTLVKDRDFMTWRAEHPDEAMTTATRGPKRRDVTAPAASRS
jgi:hypothetical protein